MRSGLHRESERSVRAGDIVFVTRGVNVAPGPKGDAGRLVPTRVRMVQETPTAMALGLYNPHVRSGKITVDSCAGPLKWKQRAITTALWTRTSCTRAASASPVAVVAAVVVAGCFGQCHNKVYIYKTLTDVKRHFLQSHSNEFTTRTPLLRSSVSPRHNLPCSCATTGRGPGVMLARPSDAARRRWVDGGRIHPRRRRYMRLDNLIFFADFSSRCSPGFSTRLSTKPGNLPSTDVPRALAFSVTELGARNLPRVISSSHGNTGIAYSFVLRKSPPQRTSASAASSASLGPPVVCVTIRCAAAQGRSRLCLAFRQSPLASRQQCRSAADGTFENRLEETAAWLSTVPPDSHAAVSASEGSGTTVVMPHALPQPTTLARWSGLYWPRSQRLQACASYSLGTSNRREVPFSPILPASVRRLCPSGESRLRIDRRIVVTSQATCKYLFWLGSSVSAS